MATVNTWGELRQALVSEGIHWVVNPNFPDDLPITRPALGADLTDWPKAATLPPVDVVALVRAEPPANTLLRDDLIARGILPPLTIGSEGVAGQGPAEGAGAPPSSVDWRNRYGWPWITEIRDQASCEHCWIYSATALVEAMVRIGHCVWCTRSEGDYIEANKVVCSATGNPATVLNWVQDNGQCGLDCVPWVDSDPGDRSGAYWQSPGTTPPPAWSPPSDRDGRTVKTPASTALGDVTAQKSWIDAVGPLVACFDVYSDFQGWSGTVPYVKSASAHFLGGHCVLVVGYNDTLGCWILKNSWGPDLGDSGYWLFGYGQCNIDANGKLGLQLTNPDPWTKRRSHAGGIIESGDGALHRNFELVAPSAGNSVTHWWRDNSSATLPWAKAEVLGTDAGPHAPTFTSTTYNRNFEFLYPTVGGQIRHWWFDQSTQKWNQGEVFASGVSAPVGFIESSYGPGNFEVVYCTPRGQLQHWWRDNATNWHEDQLFGSNVATMGPTLVQSTWGNLELVAVLESGEMQHWWRNDGGNMAWSGDQTFGSGVSSPPCMIQGQYGMNNESGNGNFELCVAMPNGTVQHWWRNNQASGFPWTMSATFGSDVATVIALLESSFGFNLEMIVQRSDNNMLQHYWRDGGGWHAGVIIGPA
jgi:Papain family cysteine protease